MPDAIELRESDEELLKKHGLKGLEELGYYGVLYRIKRRKAHRDIAENYKGYPDEIPVY